jgi:restriction system protein
MATSRGSRAEWERQRRAAEREEQQRARAEQAAAKAAAREAKQRHSASRANAAATKSEAITRTVEELTTILRRGVDRAARIDLTKLRRSVLLPELVLGELAHPVSKPEWWQFEPARPRALGRLFGGDDRHEQRLTTARTLFESAMTQHAEAEIERQQCVIALRKDHAEQCREIERKTAEHNQKIDRMVTDLNKRDRASVENYAQKVLAAVPLPPKFPRKAKVTFNPNTEQLVVQVELPPRDVVPRARGYQYVQSKDEERELLRPAKEVAELYRSVLSQVSLLYVRDLFDADPALQTIGFNGHISATNPATGKREFPCLISLNVDRSTLSQMSLKNVMPEKCLHHLKALVSPHPFDLEPIEPILDFDLSKYAFVEGLDAVSSLDSRPDLMTMTATEFEHLVRQVFEATGLEGWTTQPSKDDGVDAVVLNKAALVGGLSIVQAKRYKGVVGVNALRELAGAMEEKKAGRGILVTTSWFTTGCWTKAHEHGRIELIDGARLKYLIKEHLGKDVLIGISGRPRATGPSD